MSRTWLISRVGGLEASGSWMAYQLGVRTILGVFGSQPVSLSSNRSPGSTAGFCSSTASRGADGDRQPQFEQEVQQKDGVRPPTGVVMLNMGGPSHPDQTEAFLRNLFQDPDIINLGGGRLQNWLGDQVARRRAPRVRQQYQEIGGSPIRRWTERQAELFVRQLDLLHPATAPHKAYIAFRYADPLTQEALEKMRADGVRRAVAFSQYPHYSCTTTGSSLNHLWREVDRLGLSQEFQWSVVDRWPIQETFVKAVADRIHRGLDRFPDAESRSRAVIVFSAHSLPMKTVLKGDPYVNEIAATTHAVMQRLAREGGIANPHILAWQSKVGFLPWMGPSTSDVIKNLARQGHQDMLAVPIAFTSDHIETLHEIDIEYRQEAEALGFRNFLRAESLNDSPLLIQAQAEVIAEHLASQELHSPSYPMQCPGCTNPRCRDIRNPVAPFQRLPPGFSAQ